MRTLLLLSISIFVMLGGCANKDNVLQKEVRSFEKQRIAELVDQYEDEPPVTVTDSTCNRSAGGRHDFYSEGDYWWPNPENPEGKYIRRDGLSNPDNFLAHRLAMVRMSRIVGALTSQYLIEDDIEFARQAMKHMDAWFVDQKTKMNPHFLYAQAIKGRHTGRGIGLIDGLHLIEVARSAYIFSKDERLDQHEIKQVKEWFAELLHWMNTHEYGKKEKIHPNNHGTCWAMQAAAYAQLTNADTVLSYCYYRFKNVLLPEQMATDGSFPLELERTKPYGYSLFNLDAMSLLAQILYTSGYDDIWDYTTSSGKSMKKGIEYMYPYMKNKNTWPLDPDVLYWDNWPVSQPSLVLSGLAFNNQEYIELWKELEHDPEVVEIQRNLVMRYPLLWFKY